MMLQLYRGVIRCTTEYAHEHLMNHALWRAAAEREPMPRLEVAEVHIQNEDGHVDTPGPALVEVTYTVRDGQRA